MVRTEYEKGKRLLAGFKHTPCGPAEVDLRYWLMTHAAELIDAVEPKPMLRGRTSAETCRLNGWKVGSVLVAGKTRVKVSAIGKTEVLASALRDDGLVCLESLWDFSLREWELAK